MPGIIWLYRSLNKLAAFMCMGEWLCTRDSVASKCMHS